MQVEIDKKAQKDFLSLPQQIRNRIKKALQELANFPNVSNIKRLSNFEHSYRKRVGDYRVLFDVQEDILTIYRILHRRESY